MNIEYIEGFDAYACNLTYLDNPYCGGTAEYGMWAQGWVDASYK